MSEKLRVPNFTPSEKLHLLRIIGSKYASIIEDKKTDRASGEKKEIAWQQITKDFNASSSTGLLRSSTSLKKCYENRKKELRKMLAEEKKEVTLTGGGPLPKIKKNEADDLLMPIMNKHTLVGFQNKFDDDADTSIISKGPDADEIEFYLADEYRAEDSNPLSGGESFLHTDKVNQSISAKDGPNWRKYNATKLQEPISQALQTNSAIYLGDESRADDSDLLSGGESFLHTDKVKQSISAKDGPTPNWRKYNAAKLQESISQALQRNSTILGKDETKEVPDPKQTPKSRRRPTTVVKSLTSSEIPKKYDLLLDKRLVLVDGQLSHMKEENALIIRKRKLEIELLETELLLKKQHSE